MELQSLGYVGLRARNLEGSASSFWARSRPVPVRGGTQRATPPANYHLRISQAPQP
jgi:hypothetical protein